MATPFVTSSNVYPMGEIYLEFSEDVNGSAFENGDFTVTVNSTVVPVIHIWNGGSGRVSLTTNPPVYQGIWDVDVSYNASSGIANSIRSNSTLDPAASFTLNNITNMSSVRPLEVSSITRINTSPTNASTIDFNVDFSDWVTWVDRYDFQLTTTGTASGSIGTPWSTDGGRSWIVPVTGVSGDGTLRLDLNSGTDIVSMMNMTNIASGYTSGETYAVDHTPPTTTIATLGFSADTGTSASDFITSVAAQTISGTLSANLFSGEVVQVSLDNGAYWTNATATVGQNGWSLSGQTLTGSNTLKVRVIDAVGNSGSTLSQFYNIDTTAPTASVTTASVATGSSVTTAQSTEIGGAYLVSASASVSDQPSLDALVTGGTATQATVSAAGTDTSISTTGLNTGTYKIYTVDTAGNVSAASSNSITIVTPSPVVTASGGTTAFVEGNNVASTPVVIDSGITLTDPDSNTLATATVSITGNLQTAEDVLAFTNDGSTMGNISASYDTDTGILTLTSSGSSATLAEWEAALRSVTYTDTAIVPNTSTRTISFAVNDGANTSNSATQSVTVTATNQSPILTLSGGASTYYIGTPATPVDTNISVTDLNNTTQFASRVIITSGYQTGDTLTFTNTSAATFGNIQATWVPNPNHMLYLQSPGATATNAQWKAALEAITFTATSPGSRTLSFTISDGTPPHSATVYDTINVLSPSPALTASGGTTAFIEADNTASTPVVIDAGITLTDPDSTTFASAMVSITGNFQAGEDVLAFTNDGSTMGNISASYDTGTGILSLNSTGSSATLAEWEAALRSVTFTDTAIIPNTSTRTISFDINDGVNTSNSATQSVSVAATNQTPILTASGTTTNYSIGTAPAVIDTNMSLSDLNNTTQSTATVSIAAGFNAGDVLALTINAGTMGNITATYNTGTGVLFLSSAGNTATNAQWQAALDAVTFNTASNSTGNRTISFVINDGTTTSAAVTDIINVVAPPATGGAPTPPPITQTVVNGVTLLNQLMNTGSVINGGYGNALTLSPLSGNPQDIGNLSAISSFTGTADQIALINQSLGGLSGSLLIDQYLEQLFQQMNDLGRSPSNISSLINSSVLESIINRASIHAASALPDPSSPIQATTPTNAQKYAFYELTNFDRANEFKVAGQLNADFINFLLIKNGDTQFKQTVDLEQFQGIVEAGTGIDVHGLTAANLLIAAGGGNYTFGNGNQQLILNGPNAHITGGNGIDTVSFNGVSRAAANIAQSNGDTVVSASWGQQRGDTTLHNVARAEFSDKSVAFDTGHGEHAGQIYRLYDAAFNRAGDEGGIGYWLYHLDHQATLVDIAHGFIQSDEFASLYGADPSNAVFVEALYKNILDRHSDADGFNYWLTQLNNGAARENVLIGFSESRECVTNTTPLIVNGVEFQAWAPQ